MFTVISQSDVRAHGCPYCNHPRVFFRMSSGGTALYTCSNTPCDRGYLVVEDGMTQSAIGFGEQNVRPMVVPHPRPYGCGRGR